MWETNLKKLIKTVGKLPRKYTEKIVVVSSQWIWSMYKNSSKIQSSLNFSQFSSANSRSTFKKKIKRELIALIKL